MKLKNIIFDMDGLLFDSERVFEQACFTYAPKYNIAVTHEIYMNTVGVSSTRAKEIFLDACGDFDYDGMRADISELMFRKTEDGGIPLKSGVHDILQFLKQKGVKIALATSTRRKTTEYMLDSAQITLYFDHTVCGDEVLNAKPDPEIFLKAMELLGGTPEDTLIFEDSHNGIRAANAAGIPVIMVPDLLAPHNELRTFAIVKDLDEAQAFIAPLI